MNKTEHTITLADGSVARRTSARNYTHAVMVETASVQRIVSWHTSFSAAAKEARTWRKRKPEAEVSVVGVGNDLRPV